MNDKQLQTVLNIYARALVDIASGYRDLNSRGLGPIEMQALASRALSVGTGILTEKAVTEAAESKNRGVAEMGI
jgi:hypothetical protein